MLKVKKHKVDGEVQLETKVEGDTVYVQFAKSTIEALANYCGPDPFTVVVDGKKVVIDITGIPFDDYKGDHI